MGEAAASLPATVSSAPPDDFHFEFSTVKGYFMQSEDDTDDQKFDFRTSNFGLIERSYDTDSTEKAPWQRFEAYVRAQQASAKEGESFKVLFLGRHGQGWHNVAETKYGTKAWDCYWSALDGADGLTWLDAHLTPTGIQQAVDVHGLWSEQLPHGIPPPETFYVSPLTRTVQTADATFKELKLPQGKEYRPLIKELLREALGIHTCDKRSKKSEIENAFPHLTFEEGFSEEDKLWEVDYREPTLTRKYRLSRFLDDIFAHDESVFLSLTAHSGAIASILAAIGHRGFALETGGVIPVFVKARKVEGKRIAPPKEPSNSPPMCDGPPEL